MKITLEIPDQDLKDIMRLLCENRQNFAVAKFLSLSLNLRRRRELSDEVMSGKRGFEFPNYETMQELDRESHWDK